MAGISSDHEERFTLKALTTVELEALISATTSHDDLDLDYLNALLDEYGTREGVPSMAPERAQELFDERILPLMQSGNKATKLRNRATKSRRRRTLRAFIIASVIAALLIGGGLTALAVRTDFFGVFFKMGKEHMAFRMYSEDAVTTSDVSESIEVAEELKPLQEALEERGITDSLLPTYFPEGYEVLSTEIYDDELGFGIYFDFQKDDETISFNYSWHAVDTVVGLVEKDDTAPLIYNVNGIDYRIITNAGEYLAMWTCGKITCYISSTHEEILYEILDSIP